jgi:hypothetical protein
MVALLGHQRDCNSTAKIRFPQIKLCMRKLQLVIAAACRYRATGRFSTQPTVTPKAMAEQHMSFNTKRVERAVAAYRAETTKAAIAERKRIATEYGFPTTAANCRAASAITLKEVLEAEIAR